MNRSENINELATALCKVQAEMKSAPKNNQNPFFKSNYANMASVHETSRPLLGKNGLCVSQALGSQQERLQLTTILMHSSGQWISSDVPLSPTKNDAQSLGSYISYMRRYAEMAIIGLAADEDDDGERAMERKPEAKERIVIGKPVAAPKEMGPVKPPAPTPAQVNRLFAIAHASKWSEPMVKNFVKAQLGKDSIKDLSWKEYEKVVKHIQDNPVAEQKQKL